MAAIAAEGEVFLFPRGSDLVDLVVVGIVQSALRRGLGEIERRGGVIRLAAGTPSTGCGRRSGLIGCGRGFPSSGGRGRSLIGSGRCRRRLIGRLRNTERSCGRNQSYCQKSHQKFAHGFVPYPEL